jgi:hypothetical protein
MCNPGDTTPAASEMLLCVCTPFLSQTLLSPFTSTHTHTHTRTRTVTAAIADLSEACMQLTFTVPGTLLFLIDFSSDPFPTCHAIFTCKQQAEETTYASVTSTVHMHAPVGGPHARGTGTGYGRGGRGQRGRGGTSRAAYRGADSSDGEEREGAHTLTLGAYIV